MKQRVLVSAVAFFSLITALALSPTTYAAPGDQIITLTPTSVDQAVRAGATYTGTFEVINHGDSPFTFKVYGAPYSVTGEGYEPGFTYTPGTTQVSDWFSFSISKPTLKPGEISEVKYKIIVPANARPGGYYAAAFAETKSKPQKNGVVINRRVGELFYLRVPGPVKEEGGLVSWDSFFFQAGPLESSLRLQNSGNVHFASNIKISIRDILGSEKFKVDTTKYLLPQTIRKIDVSWDKTPHIGIFRVGGEVTILGKTQQLPDRFVLVLSIPARIVLATLLVLFILIIIIRRTISRIRRKRLKQQRFREKNPFKRGK